MVTNTIGPMTSTWSSGTSDFREGLSRGSSTYQPENEPAFVYEEFLRDMQAYYYECDYGSFDGDFLRDDGRVDYIYVYAVDAFKLFGSRYEARKVVKNMIEVVKKDSNKLNLAFHRLKEYVDDNKIRNS